MAAQSFSLLTATYHYLDRGPFEFPGVHSHSADLLEGHLEALSRWGEPLAPRKLRDAVRGDGVLPAESWIVTFDDGLKEHHDVAAPLLEKRGLSAMFFVCGLPLAERRVLTVHKSHFTRARMSPGAYWSALIEAVHVRGGPEPSGVDPGDRHPYDDRETARLKTWASHVLDHDIAEGAADDLFRSLFDERELHDQLYMSPSDLRDLTRRGFVVGSHSYSHRSLAVLDRALLRAELERSRAIVSAAAAAGDVWSVSYPFGGPDAADDRVAAAARAARYEIGFTTERRLTTDLKSPLRLGRLDANDVKDAVS